MEQVGEAVPDRDEPFAFIRSQKDEATQEGAEGAPVISVDTRKKENPGNFKNNGTEYRPSGSLRRVSEHNFFIPELGKAAPYGVYVLNDNIAFVNLGASAGTDAFSAESVRRWRYAVGKITADGGGGNGSRNRLWKPKLAKLAQEIRIPIEVSHLPPGTSKWNKIERRLCCYISRAWAGKLLIDAVTVVKLIGSTTTSKGLKVVCDMDERVYPIGVKVTDQQFDKIDIESLDLNHGWNYIIHRFVD